MNILPFWFQQGTNMKRVLLITGSPGVGKTTVLMKTVGILQEKGIQVGGMISREVRESGTRVGFEIQDLSNERRGWLAHVNLQNLNNIGVQAILEAIENCDVIAVDELGPMELFSKKFKTAVKKALASPKPVVAVVHWKAKDKLINLDD